MLVTVLATLSLIGQLAQNINAATLASASLEADGPSGIGQYESLSLPDGSWSDIDYSVDIVSDWRPLLHACRIVNLARLWRISSDERYLRLALRSVDWWNANRPRCRTNTFYNDIGAPRYLARGFLLLKDRLSDSQLSECVKSLDVTTLKASGQNKIWCAGIVLVKGLLSGDEALVRLSRDFIMSEYVFSDDEGLQRDYMYHFHGHCLQNLTYGLEYAEDALFWEKIFDGTELAMPSPKRNLIRSYVREGLMPFVYNGYADRNAMGRHGHPGSLKEKGKQVLEIAHTATAGSLPQEYSRYYPSTDFGIYKRQSWRASIRMESCRIKAFESINGQNVKGYFSSDGALLVNKSGTEYDDILAFWDGKHIPGVTSYDNGIPLDGKCGKMPPYNKSEKVFGRVDGDCMQTAMELDRDGLYAKKSWFFFPDVIICLGCGISKSEDPVSTTVEFCRLSGKVERNSKWTRHNGITYIPLDGQKYESGKVNVAGCWRWVSSELDDSPVSAAMFRMTVCHGVAPQGASYAYAVFPDMPGGREAYEKCLSSLRILENSTSRQAVEYNGKTLSVDWNSYDPDAVDLGLSVKWGRNNVDHVSWKDVPDMLKDGWRLPTEAEARELWDCCRWEWMEDSCGRGQYIVTGPSGQYIILPAAGYSYKQSKVGEGELGMYWTATEKCAISFGQSAVCVTPTIVSNQKLSIRPVK